MSDNLPPRWYCVDKYGVAMLCKDEDDAKASVIENDDCWPARAPYRAVLLGDVAAERSANTLALNHADKKSDLISRLQDEADLCRNDGASDIAALLDEAAAAVASAVPPGWKVVPVTASDAMLIAGLVECEPLGELVDWSEGFGRVDMLRTYLAMLAAAPEVPR